MARDVCDTFSWWAIEGWGGMFVIHIVNGSLRDGG